MPEPTSAPSNPPVAAPAAAPTAPAPTAAPVVPMAAANGPAASTGPMPGMASAPRPISTPARPPSAAPPAAPTPAPCVGFVRIGAGGVAYIGAGLIIFAARSAADEVNVRIADPQAVEVAHGCFGVSHRIKESYYLMCHECTPCRSHNFVRPYLVCGPSFTQSAELPATGSKSCATGGYSSMGRVAQPQETWCCYRRNSITTMLPVVRTMPDWTYPTIAVPSRFQLRSAAIAWVCKFCG